MYEVETQLAPLAAAQTQEARSDAAWVGAGATLFLPVIAVAATGPDHAAEISRLKGEQQALRLSMTRKGC